MNDKRRPVGAVALAALVIVSMVAPAAMAATSDRPDPAADSYQGLHVHEDVLTVDGYDRGALADPTSSLEYHNDSGDVADLPATVNTTQDERVGVNLSNVDADQFRLFPRVDGETENAETWSNHSNWTAASTTVSDRSIAGSVPAVTVATNGSMTAGDTASATFSREVDIQSDVSKRVLRLGFNLNQLGSGTNLSVRLVDSGGDYYAGYIDTGANADKEHVLANSTGQGQFVQVRTANLDESGTVDGIVKVEIVAQDGEATIVPYALDVESKSALTLGETHEDTDGDGETEAVTKEQWDGGVLKLTSLSTMGDWADQAVIENLEVYNVKYRAQDLADSADWRVDWENATDYPSYAKLENTTHRLTVATAIDLEHGTLTVRADQALVSERYATVEYATATGDTDVGNVTSWTSATDQFSEKGGTVDLATVSAGDNTQVHLVLKRTSDEHSALVAAGGGAPMGGGGGPLSGIWTWVAGIAGSLGVAGLLNKVRG